MIAMLIKKNDYYENPSLSNFRDKLDSMEDRGKKSVSCKTKASKPCIPKRKMGLLCLTLKKYRLP